MKKRGMLLASETLKMVLAVIGIGFLFFLLTSLYFSNLVSQNKQKAELLMKNIKNGFSKLNPLTQNSSNLYNIAPSGWNIISYVGAVQKPNQCAGENCLCICDSVYSYGGILGDRQIKECTKNGICQVFPNLTESPIINIGKTNTSIEVYRYGIFLGVKKYEP